MKFLVARVSLEMKHLWPAQLGQWLTGQVIRASRCSYGTGIGKLEEDLSSEVRNSDVNSTGDQPALAVFTVWLNCIYSNFESNAFLWLAYKPPGGLARMSNTENKPYKYSWWTLHLKTSRFRRKIFQDVRYLKGSGLLLMYKLTITYILCLTKAPVQENEVLTFV